LGFALKPSRFGTIKIVLTNPPILLPILNEGEMHFKENHPGRRYCFLRDPPSITIPKLSTPKGMLCDLDLLEFGQTDVREKQIYIKQIMQKMHLSFFIHFGGQKYLM
jgi:hypothetical protein